MFLLDSGQDLQRFEKFNRAYNSMHPVTANVPQQGWTRDSRTSGTTEHVAQLLEVITRKCVQRTRWQSVVERCARERVAKGVPLELGLDSLRKHMSIRNAQRRAQQNAPSAVSRQHFKSLHSARTTPGAESSAKFGSTITILRDSAFSSPLDLEMNRLIESRAKLIASEPIISSSQQHRLGNFVPVNGAGSPALNVLKSAHYARIRSNPAMLELQLERAQQRNIELRMNYQIQRDTGDSVITALQKQRLVVQAAQQAYQVSVSIASQSKSFYKSIPQSHPNH